MPEGPIPMTEQGTIRLWSRNAAVTAKTFPLEGISVPFDLLMAEGVGFEPTDAFGVNCFRDSSNQPDSATPPAFDFLRSLHHRAEAGEEDIILRLVLDREDLFDSGLSCGIPDRVSTVGRRVGSEGSVTHLRRFETDGFFCVDHRIHGGLGHGQSASSENDCSQNHWNQ